MGEPNREPEDMNATTLKALYEAQLEEDLQPPVDPDVDRRGTRGMLRVSRRLPAGRSRGGQLRPHLGLVRPAPRPQHQHRLVRPPVREHTRGGRRLLPELAPHGRARETPSSAWAMSRSAACWAPGSGGCAARRGGRSWSSATTRSTPWASSRSTASTRFTARSTPAGDPALLLTHMPLRNVPEGCVNVHGHLHNQEAPSRVQHINVSVEQLRYRPRPWEAICRLARHMAAGNAVRGRTTAQRLTSVP